MVEKNTTKEASLRTELFLKEVAEDIPKAQRPPDAESELRSHLHELALAKANQEGAGQVELRHVEDAIQQMGPLVEVTRAFYGARQQPASQVGSQVIHWITIGLSGVAGLTSVLVAATWTDWLSASAILLVSAAVAIWYTTKDSIWGPLLGLFGALFASLAVAFILNLGFALFQAIALGALWTAALVLTIVARNLRRAGAGFASTVTSAAFS